MSESTPSPPETIIIVLTVLLGTLAIVTGSAITTAAVFLIGFLVVLPMASRVFGDPETMESETVPQWIARVGRTGELPAGDDASESTPVEALRERYVLGEIDEAEFERELERLIETDETPEHALRDRTPPRNDTVDTTSTRKTPTSETERK